MTETNSAVNNSTTTNHNHNHMNNQNDSDKAVFVFPLDQASGVVLADANQIITHANQAFFVLTGYNPTDIIGKNCRVLQGRNTSADAKQAIRSALSQGLCCRVRILNYRKDGQPFWNLLTITPLFDSTGQICRYVGVQTIGPPEFIDRFCETFAWSSESSSLASPKTPHTHTHVSKYPLLGAANSQTTSTTNSSDKTEHSATFGDKNAHESNGNGKAGIGNGGTFTPFTRVTQADIEKALEDSSQDLPQKNTTVSFVAETLLPTELGDFRVRVYRESPSGRDIVCIMVGEVEGKSDVPVRLHDQCFTSEVLHSVKCDCREQLEWAMRHIQEEGMGMVIYLQQEGRGIGLANKIKAYSLQQRGFDTVDANLALGFPDDSREYDCVPHILHNLSISSIQLMSNNPRKSQHMQQLGVHVTNRISVIVPANSTHSAKYLQTKANRHGHVLI